MTPSVTDDQLFTALRTFLLGILPAPIDVIQAQVNRTPEPSLPDFVVMTELRRPRISTNIDSFADVKFTASIDDIEMTVSVVEFGVLIVGAVVYGTGVAAGTVISAQIDGPPGGVGAYQVSAPQTLASGTLSSGGKEIEQSTEVHVQLDVHGPNSAENAQVITTLLRDAYGVQAFAEQDPDSGVVPLYADDARQAPFINENSQFENRWVVEAVFQMNPVVRVPQQYTDSTTLEVISVEAVFPP